MSDIVLLEILVQGNQVEANLLGDDVHCRTTSESGIHIHHASVEAVAGIGGNTALGIEVIVAMVPVAEGHQVAVSELAPLGHARGATGVKHDEQLTRLDGHIGGRSAGQTAQILCKEHFALILID